jgi:hypothetical protein
MKSAVLGILVLFAGTIVMASLASSCAINHKSDSYACTITADCNDGRQCVDNFCIIPGSIDAAVFHDARIGDASQCPSGCTSCNITTHSCTIDCSQNGGACSNKVMCPPGWACNVQCDTDGACKNGVSCVGATSCAISCSAHNSCQGVQCGLGKCTVDCSGVASCQGVQCGNSCACDVTCLGSQSCTSVQCTATACKLGLGCSSLAAAACHSC